MAALTKDKDTLLRDGDLFNFPISSGAVVFAGALVVLNSGTAEGGTTATGLAAVGRCEEYRSQAGGDTHVPVRRGVFRFENSAAGDLIALADVGNTCYIVDDQTVAKTDGTGTRSAAGTVRDVDALGVWVEI